MFRVNLLAVFVLTLLAVSSLVQEHQHGNGEKLGAVHFATSCNEAAQKEFDRAVALLHSFQFSRAIEGFNAALKRDQTCAIAYWGIALSQWSNPFPSGIKDEVSCSLDERTRKPSNEEAHGTPNQVVTNPLESVTSDTCTHGTRVLQSQVLRGKMSHRVCPWWVGYFLISPLRRLRQNPAEILALFVHEGQTVLEPGPGMGFFTLELARRVGTTGRVVVVDIQPKMLERLKQRAAKATLIDRISIRLASPDSMGIEELANSVDFALAFAIVHEFPDASRFFREVAAACKVGAQLLLAEPKGHVKEADFDSELRSAAKAGFELIGRPAIRGSNAAVFKKQ